MGLQYYSAVLLGLVCCLVWFGCDSERPTVSDEDSSQAFATETVEIVILSDVQNLFGGRCLFLRGDGSGFCQIVAPDGEHATGLREKRYRLQLPPRDMLNLSQLVRDHSFFGISIKERPGVPDEARPAIFVETSSGKSARVSKWANDRHDDFDAIYSWLLEQVTQSQDGNPVHQGEYDGNWRPVGFPEHL